MSLTAKTLGALRWSFLLTLGEQGVRLVVSLVIARLLLPKEYGLTAMVTVFVSVAGVLINSGFAKAIIQNRNPSQVELCSVFYFNIAVSVVCAALLAAAGPFIAAFYHLAILAPLAAVMSVDLVISALGLVQNTLLTKKLDFKTQFWARLVGTVLSGIVGIGMAWYGCGVWSLVGQSLIANGATVGYYWCHRSWAPSLVFQLKALKPMFGFGSKLLFSALLDVLFNNIYVIVIGKAFSFRDLGLYTRAQQLQQLPIDNICNITDRVLFSSFSAIQHDKEHLRRALRKTVTSLSMIVFPTMVGLALVAKPLVLVTLTAKWAGCIPYLQLLCAAGAFYPIQVMNLSALTAQGRSDLFLRLEVIKKCILVAAVAVTWRWGIVAMIYGQIAVMLFCYVLNSYYTGRFVDYGLLAQIKDMTPYAAASLLMGSVIYLVGTADWNSNLLLLATQICAGVAMYLSTCRLFSLEAFMELWRRWRLMVGFEDKAGAYGD
jgi:O-antigen/teichoic acid export membrane protein